MRTVGISLFVMYALYSFIVYTGGTRDKISLSAQERGAISKGKDLYRKYNCQSCHQLYGLGGYLGPELTTAFSDKTRGEQFLKAMLQSGGSRMPDFHFSKEEIASLIAYLKYVDSTATPLKTASRY